MAGGQHVLPQARQVVARLPLKFLVVRLGLPVGPLPRQTLRNIDPVHLRGGHAVAWVVLRKGVSSARVVPIETFRFDVLTLDVTAPREVVEGQDKPGNCLFIQVYHLSISGKLAHPLAGLLQRFEYLS